MSQENVEIVRQVQPDPQANLVEVFTAIEDDAAVEAAVAAAASAFADDFVCIFHAISEEPRLGVQGLRDSWLDWLAPVGELSGRDRGAARRGGCCARAQPRLRASPRDGQGGGDARLRRLDCP